MFFEIKGITKRYGGLVANSNVNLHVNEHEIVGLIGPNGAGKSTLFQIIDGFVRPDAGEILFKGQNLTKLVTSKINKVGVAYDKAAALREARRLIAFTELEGKESTRIDKLTMFDRKRVELTAALATQPDILLLDELFAGLNSSEVSEMVELTRRIHQEMKMTFLIVEHVIKVIMSMCQRVYVLDYGKIIAECKPEELSKNPLVVKAYLGEEYDAS